MLNCHYITIIFYVALSSAISSSFSSFVPALHTLHLQQTMHGAANSNKGLATKSKMPKPAKIPITCVLCHITDALE